MVELFRPVRLFLAVVTGNAPVISGESGTGVVTIGPPPAVGRFIVTIVAMSAGKMFSVRIVGPGFGYDRFAVIFHEGERLEYQLSGF